MNIAEADKARGEKAEVENRDLKLRLKRAKKELSRLRMQIDKLASVSTGAKLWSCYGYN